MGQNQQFILPAPMQGVENQYSAPLTPRTPSTPGAENFTTLTNPYAQSCTNESGYDTASFYSATSPGTGSLMSPMGPQHRVTPGPDPLAYSPQNFTQYHPNRHMQHYQHLHAENQNNFDYFDENAEEDELLDVIAKWQEQED